MGYEITDDDLQEIEQNKDRIPEKEWLRLIFCELHEIKNKFKGSKETQ